MKLKVYFLVIAAALAFSVTVRAQDVSVTATIGETLDGDEVSIHSGPGPAYTEIAVSFGGTQLQVTGRNDFDPAKRCTGIYRQDIGMYLRVQFSEFEGWIWRCHPSLSIAGDLGSLPVVEPAHAVLIRDAGYPIQKLEGETRLPHGVFVAGFVVYNAALLREAPDVTSPIIGSIWAGDNVYAIGRTARAGWVKVVYAGYTGWMASHLLHLSHGWQDILPVISG